MHGQYFFQRKTHTTHGECSQQYRAVFRLCPEPLNDFIFYWHIERFFPTRNDYKFQDCRLGKYFCCMKVFVVMTFLKVELGLFDEK